MPTVPQSFLKNMVIHSFLGIFPPVPVHVLEDVKNPTLRFALEHEICKRNRGQPIFERDPPETILNPSLR